MKQKILTSFAIASALVFASCAKQSPNNSVSNNSGLVAQAQSAYNACVAAAGSACDQVKTTNMMSMADYTGRQTGTTNSYYSYNSLRTPDTINAFFNTYVASLPDLDVQSLTMQWQNMATNPNYRNGFNNTPGTNGLYNGLYNNTTYGNGIYPNSMYNSNIYSPYLYH